MQQLKYIPPRNDPTQYNRSNRAMKQERAGLEREIRTAECNERKEQLMKEKLAEMRLKQYRKSLKYKQQMKHNELVRSRYLQYKRMWCFSILWGDYLFPIKKQLHRKIEALVQDTSRKRAGKKIMLFLQKAVFDRKFRKLTSRQIYLMTRYVRSWKQKRVLQKMSRKSILFTPRGKDQHQQNQERQEFIRRRAAWMILKALKFFRKQMRLAADDIAYQWNINLLKKLNVNSVANHVNVNLLREVIKEQLAQEREPQNLRPLSRRVLQQEGQDFDLTASFSEDEKCQISTPSVNSRSPLKTNPLSTSSGISMINLGGLPPSRPQVVFRRSSRSVFFTQSTNKSVSSRSINRLSPYRVSPKKRKCEMLTIPKNAKQSAGMDSLKLLSTQGSIPLFKRRVSFILTNQPITSPERRIFGQLVQSERLKLITMDLYPLTKHSHIFILPKILRLSYQTKHVIKKFPQRAFQEEHKCKQYILKKLLDFSKKKYLQEIKNFDYKLLKFIENNQNEISMQRSRLMLLGKAQKLKRMTNRQRNIYLTSFVKEAPRQPKFKIAITLKDFEIHLSEFMKLFLQGIGKLQK